MPQETSSQPRHVSGLRRFAIPRPSMQPLQGWVKSIADDDNPGFQSKPWAGISQRFQRYCSEAFLNSGFQSKPWAGISQRFQRYCSEAFLNPGFQSKPWAGISQRFQRYARPSR
jgi:hypothetical protein